MSKAVLISIQPKWCALISKGQKTIEVRKTAPKLPAPYKCYIYCTKDPGKFEEVRIQPDNRVLVAQGKVIGEFVCDKIDKIRVFENGTVQFWMLNNLHNSCIEYDELADYIGWGKRGYGWHISGLHIYDKPKILSEFHYICGRVDCRGCKYHVGHGCDRTVKHTPQSWCYIEELEG